MRNKRGSANGIIILSVLILFVVGLMCFVLFFNENALRWETTRILESSGNIKEAIVYNNTVGRVSLSDGVNLSNMESLEFVFYGDEQYNLSMSEFKQNYEVLPSTINLENFKKIKRVEAIIKYKPVPNINSNLGSGSSPGGSSPGGSSGNTGSQSCTPRTCNYYYRSDKCGLNLNDNCGGTINCSSCISGEACIDGNCTKVCSEKSCNTTGTFCDGNLSYSCTLIDGCYNRTNISCGNNQQCINGFGCKNIVDCTSNSDCISLKNDCSYGVCNSSGKCQIMFNSSTTTCRASGGVCGKAENCTGSSAACQPDVNLTETTCRASAGVCDVAEVCSGSSDLCTADVKSTSVCRISAGICDTTEFCNGIDNSCPINIFNSSSTICRASFSVCDAEETCTGNLATCPADKNKSNGTSCSGGTCQNGQCTCVPACTGKQCGSDGCSTWGCGSQTSSCTQAFGTCTATGTKTCSGNTYGSCSAVNPITANCVGKQCGSDLCGGTCGPQTETCTQTFGTCTATGTKTCSGSTYGTCVATNPITANCVGKQCGSDLCGGTCGPQTETCTQVFGTCTATGTKTCSGSTYGTCVATNPITANCVGKQCGSDSCGGLCGICTTGTCNQATGQCVATCTNDAGCSSAGSFCDGNSVYACVLGVDGCYDKISGATCTLSGQQCVGGSCISGNIYYVRAGATGTGSGLDWNNAYTSLPEALQRGSVYYIADGTYSYYNFDDNNGEYIYIKKAIPANHGTDIGWQNTYGDEKATFSGLLFTTSNYIFDGQIGGGLGSWNTSHGFKIYGSIPNCNDNVLVRFYAGASNIEILHTEISSQKDYVMFGLKGTLGVNNNIKVSYCYIHDLFGIPFYFGPSDNIEISYSYISDTKSTGAEDPLCPYMHTGGIATVGANTNWVIKNNIWNKITGTAVIDGTNIASAISWKIYNNIFANSVTTIWAYHDKPSNQYEFSNMEFHGNIIVGENWVSQGTLRIEEGTNNKAYNNIWYDSIANTFYYYNVEHDYNYYSTNRRVEGYDPPLEMNSQGAYSEAHTQITSINPFVSWTGDPLTSNFQLRSATNPGLTLSSPFNIDMSGEVRGLDGSWDRGVLEYNQLSDINTYYVSNSGSDSNSGLSETAPFKTIAKINSINFQPGDKVLLKKGDSWREQLTISTSGTPEKPIYFGTYSTGKNPLLIQTGPLSDSAWSLYSQSGGTKIWKANFNAPGTKSTGITEDGERKANSWESNPSSLVFDETTTWTSSTMYYRKDSGAPKNTEIGIRENGILINNKNNIVIDGIDVAGPGASNSIMDWSCVTFKTNIINPSIFVSGSSTNIIIKNLIVKNSPESGISSLITANRIIVDNATVMKAGNNGIWIRSPNSVVKNSKSFENGREPADTGDRAGIGIGNCGGTNITVEGNEVYKNGQEDMNSDFEISVYGITGQVYIKKNYVHDCGSGCIQISTTGSPTDASNSEISYNIIDGYGTTTYSGETNTGKYSGIRIGSPAGSADDKVRNIKIYNNVISGGGTAARDKEGAGIAITKEGTDGAVIKNNIFYNNLGAEILLLQTSGYNINNNLYSMASKWNLDYSVKTTLSSWKSITSQDSNSKQGDPLFINYATKDFHLNSGSPAIDSGVNVGLTSDFEGSAISGTPDIGAFEGTSQVGIFGQIMRWLGNTIRSFS